MKTISKFLIWALLFFSSSLHSQNFAPFNANVSKRFYNVNDNSDNNYFFYADLTDTIGSSIFFHQYHSYQSAPPDFDSDPCFGWGSGIWAVADTTWLGNKIVFDNTLNHLTLLNQESDSIKFDFNIALNDSAIFYHDSISNYYIRFDQMQAENIYGTTDTVKTFTVLHFDSTGVIVPSNINGASIKLGKNLGLISFIDTYNFPVVETAVTLQGQIYPLIGSYQLTYDELYPFEAGDTLQFSGYKNSPWGGSNCSYIQAYYITSRSETATTVYITLIQSQQWTYKFPPDPWNDCGSLGPYSFVISYTKNMDILGKPYNHIQPYFSDDVLNGSTVVNWPLGCVNAISLVTDEEPSSYCDSCRCYTDSDGDGSTFTDYYYTPGLGITRVNEFYYSMNASFHTLDLSYYHVGGISCGIAFNIGINEEEEDKFKVYPNPTNSLVFISSEPEQVWIYDLNGRMIRTDINPGVSIDLSQVTPGLYILCVKIDGQLHYEKISRVDF